MNQSHNCPVCHTLHHIENSSIYWVACHSCNHLLQYNHRNLQDAGPIPPMPDNQFRFKIGQTGNIRGRWFQVIGHIYYLDYDKDDGDFTHHWDEWVIQFNDKSMGYLVDERGELILFAQRGNFTREIPDLTATQEGDSLHIEGYQVLVEEVGQTTITTFAGQLPHHSRPSQILNFIDCSVRNYMVGIEWYDNQYMLHYGIEIDRNEFMVDSGV